MTRCRVAPSLVVIILRLRPVVPLVAAQKLIDESDAAARPQLGERETGLGARLSTLRPK